MTVLGTGHNSILSQRFHVVMSRVTSRCAHGVLSTSGEQVSAVSRDISKLYFRTKEAIFNEEHNCDTYRQREKEEREEKEERKEKHQNEKSA